MAVLELDEELPGVTLESRAFGPGQAAVLTLVQTTAPATAVSTSSLGRVARVTAYTAEARLTSAAQLGPRPDYPVLKPALYNLTGPPRSFGGAILCFVGPPFRTIEWRMVQGFGTLTPFTTHTDELGRATCRFDCGSVASRHRVIVGVAYVP